MYFSSFVAALSPNVGNAACDETPVAVIFIVSSIFSTIISFSSTNLFGLFVFIIICAVLGTTFIALFPVVNSNISSSKLKSFSIVKVIIPFSA